jgi:hypothetical protein
MDLFTENVDSLLIKSQRGRIPISASYVLFAIARKSNHRDYNIEKLHRTLRAIVSRQNARFCEQSVQFLLTFVRQSNTGNKFGDLERSVDLVFRTAYSRTQPLVTLLAGFDALTTNFDALLAIFSFYQLGMVWGHPGQLATCAQLRDGLLVTRAGQQPVVHAATQAQVWCSLSVFLEGSARRQETGQTQL